MKRLSSAASVHPSLSQRLLLPALLILSACNGAHHKETPKAEKGILELNEWDFSKDGSLELAGEWTFVWSDFLAPGGDRAEVETIEVPGYWNSYDIGQGPIGSQGFASYRLIVHHGGEGPRLAIKVKDLQTAYELYVNGKLLLSSGTIGRKKEDSIPRYTSAVASFEADPDGETELLFHISNFHHRNGGMWEVPVLGSETSIRRNHERAASADFFIIGIIAAMGLYHILRFILKSDDKMSLFFGLFCLFIAVRALIVGELHAYRLFPTLGWSVLHRIEYLCFAAALPSFMSYIGNLFPSQVNRKAVLTVRWAGVAFAATIMLTPATIYGWTLMIYQSVTVAAGAYVVWIMTSAMKEKAEGSVLFLSGFLIQFVLVINDILYSNNIIHTAHLMDWGLMVFLVSQAYHIGAVSAKESRTVARQNADLVEARLGVILGLAKLAEYRDEDTGEHLNRIQEYSRILCTGLARAPRYRDYITEEYINDLSYSSILHDIGKVGVPDEILLKPGPLTSEEFEIMKTHTTLGGNAIADVEAGIANRTFLTLGKDIAYNHHEKWDGTGYPNGLKEREIPLSARIVALVDVYDALTSQRPYKEPFSHEKACKIVMDGRGTHFDPFLVDVFCEMKPAFLALRKELGD